jgi:hypothetical protein
MFPRTCELLMATAAWPVVMSFIGQMYLPLGNFSSSKITSVLLDLSQICFPEGYLSGSLEDYF